MRQSEIEAVLHGSNDLRQQIIDDIGVFTGALFAVFNTGEGDRLELAGTGTLVAIADSHYILTAAHVWEEVLRSAVKMGITLLENMDHVFLIDVETIVPVGPPKQISWSEWGPDVKFLGVPSGHVGTIKAYRVFYNLSTDRKNELDVDHYEARVLMGTPQVSGKFTQTHADIQINGFFMGVNAEFQSRGDFDYLDLEVDMSRPEIPESFGGVSGGGLWKVLIHDSSSTGKLDWVLILEGVAFHQSAIDNDRRIIRCHGPKSISVAMPPG